MIAGNELLITTVGGFVTLIVQQTFAMIQRNRQHKWDAEERIRVAFELAQHQDRSRHQIAATATTERTAISKKIDEATTAAHTAIDLANNTNEKLLALGLAHDETTARVPDIRTDHTPK
jgi:hypothetical protein